MEVIPTEIDGIHIIGTSTNVDSRGSFTRWFSAMALKGILHGKEIVQINHSYTRRSGTVRGMHFQHAPHAETKLVRCIRGRVWDVALDIRPNSPTVLRWHAQELTPENGLMIIIPEGCAHGFQALEDNTELLYLHTHEYVHAAEGGIHYMDPDTAIDWPLPVTELSEKDANLPFVNTVVDLPTRTR